MAPPPGGKIEAPADHVYPTGLRLALVMISIFIAMFIVSLDKLIIATAIPQITDEFHSASDIGWYGTAYLLTNCVFLPVAGKVYSFMNVKTTFLASLVLFEIGSVVCGAAPNSVAFIIGRAIAGMGASGVQSGVITIIVYAVPLAKRPQYQGLFGAVFGVSSILGPLVGGAFTTNVTWRWCFYINLPLGGVVMAFVIFLLNVPDQAKTQDTLMQKLLQLNPLGLLALLPGIVCLCLALQWGGFTYSWSDGHIIALLVLAFVLLIAFVLIQVWRPDVAMVPARIFLQRSIAGGFWVSCCSGAHMTLMVYYLSIWFQAVKSESAVKAGVHLLPMMLSLVVASIFTGILTTKLGYYMPFLIVGICITAVGSGLLTTLNVDSTAGQWIGYQILYGFGLGLSVQAPNMAAQSVLPRNQVAIGASLMFFGQALSGAIFVSVGQNVLDGQLATRLSGLANVTSQQIESAGVTGLFDLFSSQDQATAINAYNGSLQVVFRIAVIVSCLAILGGISMQWINVKTAGGKASTKDNESGQTETEHGEKEANDKDENQAVSVDEAKEKESRRSHASNPNQSYTRL